MNGERDPLARLPRESARAHAKRVQYIEMGPGRNLKAVSHGHDSAAGGPRKSHAGHVGRWSRRFCWSALAAEYDAIVAARVHEAQLADAIEYRKRAAQQARAAVQNVLLPAMGLAKRISRLGVDGGLAELSTLQLLKLAIEASRVLPDLLRLEASMLSIDAEQVEQQTAAEDSLTLALRADGDARYAIAVALEKATAGVVKPVEEKQ